MSKYFFPLAVGVVCLVGCAAEESAPARKDEEKKEPPKQVAVGKNVTMEIEGGVRRVVVKAYVCLRVGQLEQFLTRKRTKEHEAVLAADVDAREIHTALLLAGAEPGNPVKFDPKYEPARGTEIRVFVEYEKDGKKVRHPAQQWVRNVKMKKDMEGTWVFGGSRLIPDPLDKTKKPFYAANDGDVICVSNFETAMLDLPVMSSRDNDDLAFQAHTERIPPLETPVNVILEPVLRKGDKK
jgi:hypothetical protein